MFFNVGLTGVIYLKWNFTRGLLVNDLQNVDKKYYFRFDTLVFPGLIFAGC